MEIAPNLHAFLWNSTAANNCNTYLIRSPDRNILIDPGHAPYFDHVRMGLDRLGMEIADIDLLICTHAHPDHMEAAGFFDRAPTFLAMHGTEWRQVRGRARYLKAAMNMDVMRFVPDFFLKEGRLKVGPIELEVFHTPGHTPGSVTLYWTDAQALFTGDLIFKDGLGRTDLPGGNGAQLKESIRAMAAVNAQWLLPGHGEPVSEAAAVQANFERVEQMWFRYI